MEQTKRTLSAKEFLTVYTGIYGSVSAICHQCLHGKQRYFAEYAGNQRKNLRKSEKMKKSIEKRRKILIIV